MKRILQFVLIIVLLATSAYIVVYYFNVRDISQLRDLPSVLLSAIVIYIVIQLVKRFIKKKVEWFDWLYYIGLVAILLPLMMFSASETWIFDLTKYGSLFLLFPPIIELLKLIASKKD